MKRWKRGGERRDLRYWAGLAMVSSLLCLFVASFLMAVPGTTQASGMRYLPVHMHSVLNADYSADERAYVVPAVEVALIDEAVQDDAARVQAPTEEIPQRLLTVQVNLQTPVPIVTPYYRPTSGAPTQAQQPTQPGAVATPSPSGTPLPPSATSSLTPVELPTNTRTFAAPTRTPTSSSGNATALPTRTLSWTATHTRTQPPPPTHTFTSAPTHTVPPPPTRTNTPNAYPPPPTPVPPTRTPEPGITQEPVITPPYP